MKQVRRESLASMDKDPTKTDDESAPESSGGSASAPAAPDAAAARAGFCQDCGRPLNEQTVRRVGGGVFCEPCLTARVVAGSPVGAAGTVPPSSSAPAAATVPGDEPRPALAAVLGFIPGVGAMYNGQFVKGIVHLAIFVMLTFVANNVSGLGWIFCWGWIFYMAFEAYHTAVARRDGLPLPNAFGFNDLGERMNLGRSWGGVTAAPSAPPAESATSPAGYPASAGYPAAAAGAAPPVSGWAAAGTPAAPPAAYTPAAPPAAYTPAAYAAANPIPANPTPMSTAPGWTGYVSPTAFAAANRVAPAPVPGLAPGAAGQPGAGAWGQPAYADTFTGAERGYAAGAGANSGAGPAAAGAQSFPPAGRRVPASALWLIGLGVLILFANLLPDWRLTDWWAPLFFAGLSVWVLVRRLRPRGRVLNAIRLPILLMALAVMLALHAANVALSGGVTAAVLLILLGALMLLERLVSAGGGRNGSAAAWPGAAGSGTTGSGTAGSGYAGPVASAAASAQTWSGDAGLKAATAPEPSGEAAFPARAEWGKREDGAAQDDPGGGTKGAAEAPSGGLQDGAEGRQGGPPEGQGSR